MINRKDRQIIYRSSFRPPSQVEKLLREGRIIDDAETPASMVERVVAALLTPEIDFGTSVAEREKLTEAFGQLLDSGQIAMSTPIMTNAGRFDNRPLSACIVPPINLRKDLTQARTIIDKCHQDGMGTGFDLSNTDSPLEVLRFLNTVAVEGV